MTEVNGSNLFADKQISQNISWNPSARISKLSINKHVGKNISLINSGTREKSSIKSQNKSLVKPMVKSPVSLSGKTNPRELPLNIDRYGNLNGIICKVIGIDKSKRKPFSEYKIMF